MVSRNLWAIRSYDGENLVFPESQTGGFTLAILVTKLVMKNKAVTNAGTNVGEYLHVNVSVPTTATVAPRKYIFRMQRCETVHISNRNTKRIPETLCDRTTIFHWGRYRDHEQDQNSNRIGISLGPIL